MYARPIGGTAVASMLMYAPDVWVTLIVAPLASLGAAVHAFTHVPSATVKLPPPSKVPMAGDTVAVNAAGPPDEQMTMIPGAPGSSNVRRGSTGVGRTAGPARVVASLQAESATNAHRAARSRPDRKPSVILLDSVEGNAGAGYQSRPH